MTEPRITDDQARALWRRAAELQAAAERDALQQRALQPGEPGDLSIEQVAAAAEGAGIDPAFVRIAVAEQRLPDSEDLGHDDWRGRWLQRVLRASHVIEEERAVAAPPATVLAAFRAVAAGAAYQLVPEDTIGADPLNGAVLVYRITGDSAFATTMDFADGRVLLVTFRPHEHGTLARVRVPLFRRGINLLGTGIFSTVLGAGGAGLLGSIASAVGASALVLAAPVAAGAVAGGALGVVAYRGLYRAIWRGGSKAIGQLLNVVAVEAERGAA